MATAGVKALLQPRSWTTVKTGLAVALNAVVQPVMSRTTYYMPNSDQPKPGLVAIGSPALANPTRFYDGLRFVGTANLDANGTLATLKLSNVSPGLHLYSARYPKDAIYNDLTFGLIAVYVTR